MEYYSVIKKNGTLPFATTWIDPECIMLSKINQTEKTNSILSHYMWKLEKKKRNKETK